MNRTFENRKLGLEHGRQRKPATRPGHEWTVQPFSYDADVSLLLQDYSNRVPRSCEFNTVATLLMAKTNCTLVAGKGSVQLPIKRPLQPQGWLASRPYRMEMFVKGQGEYFPEVLQDAIWDYPAFHKPTVWTYVPHRGKKSVAKVVVQPSFVKVTLMDTGFAEQNCVRTVSVRLKQESNDDGRCVARMVTLPALLKILHLVQSAEARLDATRVLITQYDQGSLVGHAKPNWMEDGEWERVEAAIAAGKPLTLRVLPERLQGTIYESLTLGAMAAAAADANQWSLHKRVAMFDFAEVHAAVQRVKTLWDTVPHGLLANALAKETGCNSPATFECTLRNALRHVLGTVNKAVDHVVAVCQGGCKSVSNVAIETLPEPVKSKAPTVKSKQVHSVDPVTAAYAARATLSWKPMHHVPWVQSREPKWSGSVWEALSAVAPVDVYSYANACVKTALEKTTFCNVNADAVKLYNTVTGEIDAAKRMPDPPAFWTYAVACNVESVPLAGSPVWMQSLKTGRRLPYVWDFRMVAHGDGVHRMVHAVNAPIVPYGVFEKHCVPYPWMFVYWLDGPTPTNACFFGNIEEESLEQFVQRCAVSCIQRAFKLQPYEAVLHDKQRVVDVYTGCTKYMGYTLPKLPSTMVCKIAPDDSIVVECAGSMHPLYCLPYSVALQMADPDVLRFYLVHADNGLPVGVIPEAIHDDLVFGEGHTMPVCNVGDLIYSCNSAWRWSSQPAAVTFTRATNGWYKVTVTPVLPVLPPFVSISDSNGRVCQVVDQRHYQHVVLYKSTDTCTVPYCANRSGNKDCSPYRLLCTQHFLEMEPLEMCVRKVILL
jgi:hypothetical protein